MQLLVRQLHLLVVQLISYNAPPDFVLAPLQKFIDFVLELCRLLHFLQLLIVPYEVFILVLLRLQPPDLAQYLIVSHAI